MFTVPIPRSGTLLRRFRQAAGLPQEVLTDHLARLSVRGIQKLERGASHMPRRDTVELLATASGLAAEDRPAVLAAARPPLSAARPERAALVSAGAGQRAQQTEQCPGWFLRASYACRYGW